ncbi:CoA-disulfide reductase [Staphylococcus massiliensis]|uniref:CoA-disulfide reductase n=1 Tax=Staphylococcus massiliensis TaxID=555791 RepID=UPI001EDCF25C|nr:CoA-disulfide reductase [Staphylococcus massiliensis]MCG3401620.1 CoA-disulfide reductase [Staphylococcus massiliensis]
MSKIVVVGAVAGGATCASQIRRLNDEIAITIYEKDRDMSFANCGLPYYLGDVIKKRESVLAIEPKDFKDKKNIDVHTYHEVIAVDSEAKTVTVKNHQTGETFEDTYDYLILSPGCRAKSLGFDADFIFTLRNMEDTDRINDYIEAHDVKRVLLVGAGYISLEMLENMYHRGLKPTLIHRSDQVNKLMDQDMNQVILDAMDERDIPYYLNEEIDSIEGHDVTFKSGKTESFDMIIEGVGVAPNSEFLKGSGVERDDKGYVPVNEKFETNADGIYALGDVITSFYRHVDLKAHVPLAFGAHRAASIIAEQLEGRSEIVFKGFVGANIVKFFQYTLASTGVTVKDLDQFDYDVVNHTSNTHAGYYPDNSKMHIRVYFEKSSRKILRAAAVGEKGVDKRIDVMTMAIIGEQTIDDLTEFEVAYAPPYNHPKDIINMVGYKARNK